MCKVAREPQDAMMAPETLMVQAGAVQDDAGFPSTAHTLTRRDHL